MIIPIATRDTAWRELAPDLSALGPENEVIFVGDGVSLNSVRSSSVFQSLSCQQSFFKQSELGRANQLNAGERVARNEFLWFLHCDCRFSKVAFEALKSALLLAPEAVHFFDLRFSEDGPELMRINEFGVWIRSRILRLPFGDQGLAMSRSVFEKLGGFNERTPYGEDHLLVWRAHQDGVRLRAIGYPLHTSARKYNSNGWGKTTANHLALTLRQALPEFVRLLRKRMSS